MKLSNLILIIFAGIGAFVIGQLLIRLIVSLI